MTSLQLLLLNANEIECIRRDAFRDLHSLSLLSLYDNNLQSWVSNRWDWRERRLSTFPDDYNHPLIIIVVRLSILSPPYPPLFNIQVVRLKKPLGKSSPPRNTVDSWVFFMSRSQPRAKKESFLFSTHPTEDSVHCLSVNTVSPLGTEPIYLRLQFTVASRVFAQESHRNEWRPL